MVCVRPREAMAEISMSIEKSKIHISIEDLFSNRYLTYLSKQCLEMQEFIVASRWTLTVRKRHCQHLRRAYLSPSSLVCILLVMARMGCST